MAKALRSTYKFMQRKGVVSIPNEYLTMHVTMMGTLYYLYSHHPQLLKFRNIFEMVFGDWYLFAANPIFHNISS
jgi:hypothetical protein